MAPKAPKPKKSASKASSKGKSRSKSKKRKYKRRKKTTASVGRGSRASSRSRSSSRASSVRSDSVLDAPVESNTSSAARGEDEDSSEDDYKGKRNPEEDYHHFGFYRHLKTKQDELKRFNLLRHAFRRTFPWPPKHKTFFSTGYYLDMDGGGGGSADLKINEIMLRCCPKDLTDDEIRKQFPTMTGVTRRNGEVIVQFGSIPEAKKAFKNSKLMKLGERILLWPPKPGIIVTDIPLNVSVSDLQNEFPEAEDITLVPGPGNMLVASITFPNQEAADRAFKDSHWKKKGGGKGGGDMTLKYVKDDLSLTVTNLPPEMTKEDLKKVFPRSKDISLKDGTAKITYVRRRDLLEDVKKSGYLQLGDPTKLSFLAGNQISVERMLTGANEEYIRETFPNATNVKMDRDKRGQSNAIVTFATNDEAKQAIRHKNVQIFGDPVQRRVLMKLKPLNWRVDEIQRRRRLYALKKGEKFVAPPPPQPKG